MSITMNTMIVAVTAVITMNIIMNPTIAVVAAVIIRNMPNTLGASC